jgi:hypothetical protein
MFPCQIEQLVEVPYRRSFPKLHRRQGRRDLSPKRSGRHCVFTISQSVCPIATLTRSEVTTLHTSVINFDRSVQALHILGALSRPRHNPCTSVHMKRGYLVRRRPGPLASSCSLFLHECDGDSKIGPGDRMWFFPGPGRFGRKVFTICFEQTGGW